MLHMPLGLFSTQVQWILYDQSGGNSVLKLPFLFHAQAVFRILELQAHPIAGELPALLFTFDLQAYDSKITAFRASHLNMLFNYFLFIYYVVSVLEVCLKSQVKANFCF